jgi:hypothetical protein
MLLSDHGVVFQPSPRERAPSGWKEFEPTALCEDGVIYYSLPDLPGGPDAGPFRQRIHIEPFMIH